MKKQSIIEFVKSAIEHNKRTEEYLETILNALGAYNPESSCPTISEVRSMDSMQMIEEILDSPKSLPRTIDFVAGLKQFYEQRHGLSESQRFHLESTYQSIFGDS